MPTAPDFTPTTLDKAEIKPSGFAPQSKNMLGAAGDKTNNHKGAFVDTRHLWHKTFMLQPFDQTGADVTTGTVDVEATMTLDATDEVANTKIVKLGTLTAAARSLNVEAPWRYIRCRVSAGDPVNMQVVMHALGT